MKFIDSGNESDYTAACEALIFVLSMWRVLSLAGEEGISVMDDKELQEALMSFSKLGVLLSNTVFLYIDELEAERLMLARRLQEGDGPR